MMLSATQTDLFKEVHETYELCISRVDLTQYSQETLLLNIERPTMTNTQQTQLEASNNFNHKGIRRHNRPR